MPSKALAIPQNNPGQVIEPFQHPAPKLVMEPPDMRPWKMTPPSLSPLHMSPPNMLLPNFSPIQDHMPLPTLSASTFIPPQSFLTHTLREPPSVVKFNRHDPTVLAVGSCYDEPDSPRPVEQECSVTIFKVKDVEREVRGDREMIAREVYEVRKKVRPQLQEMAVVKTPSGVLDLAFSPHDPELLLATLATGQILAYQVRRGRYTIKHLSTHTLSRNAAIFNLEFSPTSLTLAAATLSDGTVHLLDIPRQPRRDNSIQPLRILAGHSSPVVRAAFTADGKQLFTSDQNGTIIAWNVSNPQKPRERWRDDTRSSAVTSLLSWPAPHAADVDKKRRLLLTGTAGGELRILDLSSHNRPPLSRQTLDLGGQPWRLAALPPVPNLDEIDGLGAGAFSAAARPDVETDPEVVGVLAAAGEGGARLLMHKQKFEEIFLPRRDGSDIVDWTTSDGVKMDHEGKEKQYWWYDLADMIEDHKDGDVYAGDAVAMVDYDPLFKDAGEQRLRRGWRLVSVGRDGTMCFWQVYVE